MVVVIANDLPPAVRGRLKLWFIEPKSNVFVSGIKDSVAEEVIDYLFKSCTPKSGLIIIQRLNKVPYYKIYTLGDSDKRLTTNFGMQLIIEKLSEGN